MAITMGFTTSLSDVVVLDQAFENRQSGGSGSASDIQSNPNQDVVSTYVFIATSGNLVYENAFGEAQYIAAAPAGLIPISATKILSSALVRGVFRSTTAMGMSWMADIKY